MGRKNILPGEVVRIGISSLPSRLANAVWSRLLDGDRRLLLLVLAHSAIALTFMFAASMARPGILEVSGADTNHYLWISRTLYRGWEEVESWNPEGVPDPGGSLYAFAHFPLYPLVFGIVSLMLLIDRLTAAFVVTIVSMNLLLIVFYKLGGIHGKRSIFYPMLLIAANYQIPLQSVLATYACMFMLLIFASYLYFGKDRMGPSALLAGLAQATHFTAWVLFPGYVLCSLLERRKWRSLCFLSIPISLGLVFTLFWLRSGDFLAYIRYNAGHPYHHYFPFSTFLGFLTSEHFSIWNKSLVLFSTGMVIIGAFLLLREKRYLPAILGLGSLLAAASIGPAHGFPRYSLPAMICLLGFTATDLERNRWAWVAAIALCAVMYGYAFQAILTNR